jgi:thioredoxin 1
MNANTKEFNDSNFEESVIKSDKITIVDFWAEWCGPCRTLGPIIDDIANSYGDKINVGKLNIDKNPEIATTFGITSIPTILFFREGKLVDRIKGLVPKKEVELKLISIQNN